MIQIWDYGHSSSWHENWFAKSRPNSFITKFDPKKKQRPTCSPISETVANGISISAGQVLGTFIAPQWKAWRQQKSPATIWSIRNLEDSWIVYTIKISALYPHWFGRAMNHWLLELPTEEQQLGLAFESHNSISAVLAVFLSWSSMIFQDSWKMAFPTVLENFLAFVLVHKTPMIYHDIFFSPWATPRGHRHCRNLRGLLLNLDRLVIALILRWTLPYKHVSKVTKNIVYETRAKACQLSGNLRIYGQSWERCQKAPGRVNPPKFGANKPAWTKFQGAVEKNRWIKCNNGPGAKALQPLAQPLAWDQFSKKFGTLYTSKKN